MGENRDLDEIKNLRVRYSVIANYGSMIYRFITALAFSTIVIRRLSIEEYGIFTTVLALIYLFQPIPILWNSWVYRFYIRRNYRIVSAGLFLTLLFTLISDILLAIMIFYFIGSYLYILFNIITLSMLLMYSYFSTILSSSRPYTISYMIITGETTRVVSAYVLVYLFNMRLLGVFLTLTIYSLSMVIVSYLLILRYRLHIPKPLPNKDGIVALLKNLYISIINVINTQIMNSAERLIVVSISGSLKLVAYLGVSYIPRSFIRGGVTAFTRGLTSRLLRQKSKNDIEDVLRLFFVIGIFIGGVFIIYSKTILSVFKKDYVFLYPLFSLYVIMFLIYVFRAILSSISTALEEKDKYEQGFGLKGTVLFKNPLTHLISNISYISIGTTIFLYMLLNNIKDPLILLIPFPLSALLVYIPTTVIFYKRSIEKIRYNIPWRELFSSLTGVIILYLYSYLSGLNNYIISSIYREYPKILFIATSSITIYIAILLILSPWTRKFIRIGIKNILTKNEV